MKIISVLAISSLLSLSQCYGDRSCVGWEYDSTEGSCFQKVDAAVVEVDTSKHEEY